MGGVFCPVGDFLTILAMGAIALKVEEGWGGLEVLLEVFDGDPGVNKNIS